MQCNDVPCEIWDKMCGEKDNSYCNEQNQADVWSLDVATKMQRFSVLFMCVSVPVPSFY